MKWLDLYKIYKKIDWILWPVIAIAVAFWSIIVTIATTIVRVKNGNSKPEDRKEGVGETDANGYKQVEQQLPPSFAEAKDVPTGTTTGTVIVVEAKGEAKPSEIPAGEPSTGDLINKLDEIIEGK